MSKLSSINVIFSIGYCWFSLRTVPNWCHIPISSIWTLKMPIEYWNAAQLNISIWYIFLDMLKQFIQFGEYHRFVGSISTFYLYIFGGNSFMLLKLHYMRYNIVSSSCTQCSSTISPIFIWPYEFFCCCFESKYSRDKYT